MENYDWIIELHPGTPVSLDLMNLWQKGYSSIDDCEIPLVCEGYLSLSPNEECEDEEDEMFDPYIDLYTDKGPVLCDGETCDVIAVDPDNETIELKSRDYDETFCLAFEDAQYCIRL